MIQLVFATNQSGGFGYKGGLPWGTCRKDLAEFKKETMGTDLLMGALTFESLPSKLPGRKHIVICNPSRPTPVNKAGQEPDHMLEMSVAKLWLTSVARSNTTNVSIIGGVKTIQELQDYADRMIYTVIHEKQISKSDVRLHSLIIPKGVVLDREEKIYNHMENNIDYIVKHTYKKDPNDIFQQST